MDDIWLTEAGSREAEGSDSGVSYINWSKEEALSAPIFQGAQEIGARDLASLAVISSKYHAFFKRVHGIEASYKNDINGTGEQFRSVSIRSSDGSLIAEFSSYFGSSNDDNFVYEADLWRDQRKSSMPTLNRGKHKFDIKDLYLCFHDQAKLFNWVRYAYPEINSHISLFNRNRDDLIRWTQAGLDMRVVCYMTDCRNASILSNEQLMDLRKKGEVLASLSRKLRCSKCGAQPTGHRLVHKLLPEISDAVSTIQNAS